MIKGQIYTDSLRAGQVLTVTTAASSTAIVERFNGDYVIDTTGLSASSSLSLGPYLVDCNYRISCVSGTLTYAESQSTSRDYLTAAEVAAAYQPIVGVSILSTVGGPVDYTDGSPPATGEGTAEIGSLCADRTSGKLYINGGTKAQPLWKIITSAA